MIKGIVKKYYSGFIILLFVVFGIHSQWYGNYHQEKFNAFNSSHIDGRITWMELRRSYIHFKINGQDQEYAFRPKTLESKFPRFEFVAQIGDRVYKERLDNIIILYHENRELKYIVDY